MPGEGIQICTFPQVVVMNPSQERIQMQEKPIPVPKRFEAVGMASAFVTSERVGFECIVMSLM